MPSFPLSGAERVVVRRAGHLSHRLLAGLGERGVGLLILGGRKGEPMAHLLGLPHGDVRVKQGQFVLAQNETATFNLARFLLRGKVAGHLALLREATELRPDRRKPLFDAVVEIHALEQRLGEAGSLERLRGLEGAAAASFFRAYQSLFSNSLGFLARNRRPPRDPVNACLSLTYTLLHAEAVRAAWVAGLEPLLGFLHAPSPGRASLASDLIEPCRPAADRWVWELFRSRSLRADHFTDSEGACLLGKAGRAVFYEAYEAFVPSERRRLRHMAALFARAARTAADSSGEATLPPTAILGTTS